MKYDNSYIMESTFLPILLLNTLSAKQKYAWLVQIYNDGHLYVIIASNVPSISNRRITVLFVYMPTHKRQGSIDKKIPEVGSLLKEDQLSVPLITSCGTVQTAGKIISSAYMRPNMVIR